MSDVAGIAAIGATGLPERIRLPGKAGDAAKGSGFSMPSFAQAKSLASRPDLFLAIAVMGILVVLIFPLPAVLLDLLLAVSIIVSVLILMTALFIENPMEFSVFPTVLLIATMFRLALNMASTRLILSHGHSGGAAAGHVIEAFGQFVMSGNFVIGVIVFIILVLVNFVVITKGSGRIAEVAARFTLDAMPGKQMAIDADLSAGLIDQEVARERRKGLEDESAFFGAMDGASKFVRGDAVAALLITFINIVGGMIIGLAQQGLSFAEAGKSYTLLTVGDGLVSQVPALIVSTAAGLLVSKAGIRGAAAGVLGRQFAHYPKALGMSAAVMGAIGLLPGIPILPFALLGGGAGYLAWRLARTNKHAPANVAAKAGEAAAAGAAQAEETAADLLKIDDLKIEIGYALLPLVNGAGQGGTTGGGTVVGGTVPAGLPCGEDRLTDQIKALRRQLAGDLGFVMPAVRILDNVQLEPNAYVIRVKEVEAGSGKIFPSLWMAMDPMGGQVQLPGQHMLEPTFGLPATWIDAALRDEAQLRGLHGCGCRHRAGHAPDRGHQGPYGRPPLAHRDPEAAQGAAQGARRPRQGARALADLHHRYSARAAAAAGRARLHPRSRHHPGGHLGRGGGDQEPTRHLRTCPHPPRPADLRPALRAGWPPADHHPVANLGSGLPGFHRRPGRGAPPRHAALEARRIRRGGARAVRGGGTPRRDAGTRHVRRVAPLRALDHRALPARDARDRPGRDPHARAAEDGRQRVSERPAYAHLSGQACPGHDKRLRGGGART